MPTEDQIRKEPEMGAAMWVLVAIGALVVTLGGAMLEEYRTGQRFPGRR